MTTTLVTLTGDVTDAIASDFDYRRTKVYVRYNTDKVVTDDDIRLGGGTVNIESDGTFTLPNVVAATSLVENLQATVVVDYPDASTRKRATETFGPYDLSAESGTVDIGALETVQALPATAISEATAALDAIVAEGQALLNAQEVISGLTGEDDAVALLVNTPASDTAGALAATIAARHADLFSMVSVTDPQFGAVGDGVADDTAAIQAAIDYGRINKKTVFFPSGRYKTTNTLHLGISANGGSFSSVHLLGPSAPFSGSTSFTGAVIEPTQTDRPAINFQGARRSSIKGIAILGKLEPYITANDLACYPVDLGGTDSPAVDDTVATNWLDPTHASTGGDRYRPYAGITIDAFSGTTPPGGGYPSGSGTYGSAYSSDVLIEDVVIRGFNTGIVCQPSNADGNGDYVKIRHVNIDYCCYGISFGNSQSRTPTVEKCNIVRVFCAITNNVHGRQSGRLGGTISDLGCGYAIKLFDINMSTASTTKVKNLASEISWSLGRINVATQRDAQFIMENCQIEFNMRDPKRGEPTWMLDCGSAYAVSVIFKACVMSGFYRVFNINSPLGFQAQDGCVFTPADAPSGGLSLSATPTRRYSYNALAGGLISSLGRFSKKQSVQFVPCNLGTGAVGTSTVTEEDVFFKSDRVTCIPIHLKSTQLRDYPHISVPVKVEPQTINKASVTCALVNKTLTITFGSRTETQFALYGPLPGDILTDPASGSVFFVKSRTALVVTAELVNNFKTTDGGTTYTPITSFNAASGTLYITTTRMFTPPQPLLGTLTSGSATITNIGRDDGSATWLTSTELLAGAAPTGDWMYVDGLIDRLYSLSGSNAKVTAYDTTARTLTMGTTMLKSATGRLLTLFLREPPANE